MTTKQKIEMYNNILIQFKYDTLYISTFKLMLFRYDKKIYNLFINNNIF